MTPSDMLQREDEQRHRGRLKIFFGASAGVGKTYAMLQAARRRHDEGDDVVIGIVETHGRSETAALLAGLEVLPQATIEYHNHTLKEFDLDAALARHPQLILVDELAHSNAPGARHLKRWQDVQELLDAGIDVYTTVNVQHLESLNDVVGQITGIRVFETRPRPRARWRRRSDARRPAARGTARTAEPGQGLHAAAGRARGAQFLSQGQPDRAARTRAATHGRSRRCADARVSRRPFDRAHLAGARPAAGVRRPGQRRAGARPRGRASCRESQGRLDRRVRRDAASAEAPRRPSRTHAAGAQVRRRTRCGDGDARGRGRRRDADRLCAGAQCVDAGGGRFVTAGHGAAGCCGRSANDSPSAPATSISR